jgi:predicted RND superfamily exporter protein
MIAAVEQILFRYRGPTLAVLAAFTLLTGVFAFRVGLETAFEKHLPLGHEYIETFLEYREELAGVNRVIVVLHAKQGDIWNAESLAKLSEATDALFVLPGIDRRTVTSLWTPNVRYIEITEDGMRSEDVIGADITAASITPGQVERIRDRVIRGGYIGQLVSNDHSAAMLVADLVDVDPRTREPVDYAAVAGQLERDIRGRLQDERYGIHIIGFVKMIGDISDGARSVVFFFALAFVLTALAVYAYSRSWILTVLPLFCSLVSVIWQFGLMQLLGFGVDPLAILVPFLVFAIGVSHGIQQINLIAQRIVAGDDAVAAARASFRGLLVPGSMALTTDLIAFAALYLVPIPMIQELGLTATLGVALKIVSNLVMLPVIASYFTFDGGFTARTRRSQELSARVMRVVGRLAEPRAAVAATIGSALLLGLGVWQSRDRHVGDLHAGATELRADSRYNRDARLVVEKFDVGLDVLSVLAETPEEACIDHETMAYVDRFGWHMENVPGVQRVISAPVVSRVIHTAWNEGNLKWRGLPRNRYELMQATSSIPSELGAFNASCTLMPIQIFTTDHRADTIRRTVAAAAAFKRDQPDEREDGVTLRLASGNVGVQAATNEVLERSELPMMLLAYAAIIVIVGLTYRDWRATICCCVPLVVATFVGYWFMKELEIGLKVATLPVMVLAVGIGVDYSLYIYNRLEIHRREGEDVTTAFRNALLETGNAVVFTGITLAIGVSTWSFSSLKFQADMGLLLAFMFVVDMLVAATTLPALAVVLERLFPRRDHWRARARATDAGAGR